MSEVLGRKPDMSERAHAPEDVKRSFATSREVLHLLATLFALIVTDWLLSNSLLRLGLVRELNPFLQGIAGEQSLVLIKVAGALLAVLILWDIYKRKPQIATVSSFCSVILYTGIVYWNLFAFFIAAQV